jgi:hypothetical protein
MPYTVRAFVNGVQILERLSMFNFILYQELMHFMITKQCKLKLRVDIDIDLITLITW